MQLEWHKYKYFPYERDLAKKEIHSLLKPKSVSDAGGKLLVSDPQHPELAERLVYFASSTRESESSIATNQQKLERINGNGPNRQSTRYSVHGLHEYKGKFNPQVAKVLLNIFGAHPGHRVLDPFCGSGTSLVESAHLGIEAVGMDINPFAAFVANAKLRALGAPAADILQTAERCLANTKRSKWVPRLEDERGEYLASWFPSKTLVTIERLRRTIAASDDAAIADILLALASDLLRDYSLQEPHDLRIRRRKSPLPDIPFLDAFEQAVRSFVLRLSDSQQTLGVTKPRGMAVNFDCTKSHELSGLPFGEFDMALTSPPYATALPYIDTQRLSLVWLDLLKPKGVSALEAELVGSREIRGKSKQSLMEAMEQNIAGLPQVQVDYCLQLQSAIGEGDGFRRQLMPRLLYRYFANMAQAFTSVQSVLRPGAPFGLIVGSNHTVLGGQRFDIETPEHLASIAESRNWSLDEIVPLQTYQRYGLHSNNATKSEALIVLRSN